MRSGRRLTEEDSRDHFPNGLSFGFGVFSGSEEVRRVTWR